MWEGKHPQNVVVREKWSLLSIGLCSGQCGVSLARDWSGMFGLGASPSWSPSGAPYANGTQSTFNLSSSGNTFHASGRCALRWLLTGEAVALRSSELHVP